MKPPKVAEPVRPPDPAREQRPEPPGAFALAFSLGGAAASARGQDAPAATALEAEPPGNGDQALERSADQVAARALAAPAPAGLPEPARAPRREEEEAGPRSASAASLRLGAGAPLGPALQTEYEGRFGLALGAVRIHTGPSAARTAENLGADAVAMGDHIAFARGRFDPGSGSGQRLLAHELAHVAQQRAGLARADRPLRQTAEGGPRFVVDDDAPPAEGQLRKRDFLAQARTAVTAAADQELAAANRSTAECPWIDRWFAYYEQRDAAHVERALRRYAPGVTSARAAADYLPPLVDRVRTSVRAWVRTGRVEGLPEGLSATPSPGDAEGPLPHRADSAAPAPPAVQAKAASSRARPQTDPGAVQERLGPGRPLDSAIGARMGTALRHDFSQVRVHTDGSAAALARELDARAFTAGPHVAFAAGQYRPGSLLGDALIAHELAHVVQQSRGTRGGTAHAGGDAALERDADRSALGALASLWARLSGERVEFPETPRLRTGLALQRCPPGELEVGDHAQLTAEEQRVLGGIGIIRDPNPGELPAFVGSSMALRLRRDVPGSDPTYPRVRLFRVEEEGEQPLTRIPDSAGISRILLLHTGNTRITALVEVSSQVTVPVTLTQRVVEPTAYTNELLAQFRRLYQRKQDIVNGQGAIGDLDLVELQLSDTLSKLRAMGLNLEPDEILSRLQAGTNLQQVTGRFVRDPPGDLFLNQRARMQILLDYLPPGREARIHWTWHVGSRSGDFFRFGNRTTERSLTLDEGFWTTEREHIRAAGGFEIQAEVYIGDESNPRTTLSTGTITATQEPPAQLTLRPGIASITQGSTQEFTLAEWAPSFSEFQVNWLVNGQPALSNMPSFRYTFSTVGRTVITANILQGQRQFGEVRNGTLYRQAIANIDVQSAETAAGSVLDHPPPGGYPTLAGVQGSIATSIAEMSQREAQGGEQAAYWHQRRIDQERRRESFERNVPSQRGAQPLPADPTRLVAGQTYSAAVPAVLVLPQAGGVQPISVYMTVRPDGTQWQARLLDVTGVDVYPFNGTGATPLAAYEAAVRDWIDRNPYPRGGTVVYRFAPPGWTLAGNFTTNSDWKTFRHYLDSVVAAGAVIVAGLLLVAPEATLTKYLGMVILAATVARSTIAIYENLGLGISATDPRNVMEAVSIATAFIGVSGGVLRGAGLRLLRPVMYRVGNWLVLTALVSDAGTLVYVSAHALEQLRAIQADPTRDEAQKALDIVALMATLVAQGVMIIVSNRDLFRGGLRRSDFLPTDPRATAAGAATGEVRLDTGQRLDVAAELRRAGDTPEGLRSQTDRGIVDRFNSLTWLREGLTAAEVQQLLRRLSTESLVGLRDLSAREAFALVERLGNDAVANALAPALGGTRLRGLLDATSPAKVAELHGTFGPAGVRTLLDELTADAIGRLMRDWNAAKLQRFSQQLGNAALKNLALFTNGPHIEELVRRFTPEVVAWVAGDQPGREAVVLLNNLRPDVLRGLMGNAAAPEITGSQAKQLYDLLGPHRLETVVPQVSGSQLTALVNAFGEQSARDVVRSLIDASARPGARNRIPMLADFANNLRAAQAQGVAPSVLSPHSFVVDNNVLAGIRELMTGTPWARLPSHKQNAINRIRELVGLPRLTTDPPGLALTDIVGNAELVAPNVVLAEGSGAAPGAAPVNLPRSAVTLTVERNHPDYNAVRTALETPPAAPGPNGRPAPPPVGGQKGARDRAIVADAIFAQTAPPAAGGTPSLPRLVTMDQDLFSRLAYFGPPGTVPPLRPPPRRANGSLISEAEFVAINNPNGFVATIPLPDGRSRQLLVIPIIP